MAVSLEGTFILIDRASDALRRIERQAQRTDRALKGTGESMDKISSPQQVRNLEKVDRQMRNVERDTQKLDAGFKRTERSAGMLDNRLIKIGAQLAAISRIISLMKFPVLIGGIGLAAQGIGALAGGVTALLPALTDMSAVMAALPATLIGVGGAAIATKLALGGVSDALGGNEEAMKRLTPQAREFVRTLKDMQPLVREMRQAAQRGMFPGLTRGVNTLAQRGAPTAQRLLGRYGREVGGAAERGAQRLTQGGTLRDIDILGRQGARIFSRMVTGALNLADALRNVAVAARPFTEWLTRTVVGWSEMLKISSENARESGRLADFFNRARNTLENVFRIAGNLWNTIRGILRAARPLTEHLINGFRDVTQVWEEFTNSAQGQQRMRRWFRAIRAPLDQFFGLIGDVARAWFRLTERGGGREGALTKTMTNLRDIVKPVERLLGNAAEALGPSFIEALGEFVKLLNNIPFTPMKVFLDGLTLTMRAINSAVKAVPGLGTGIGIAVTAAAAAKAIPGVGGGGGGIGGGGSSAGAGLGELLSRRGGRVGAAGKVLSRASAVPVWVVNQVPGGAAGAGGGFKETVGKWAGRAAPIAAVAARAIPLVAAGSVIAYLAGNVNRDRPTGAGSGRGNRARQIEDAAAGHAGDPSKGVAPMERVIGGDPIAARAMKDESAIASAVTRGHNRQKRSHRSLQREQNETKRNTREMAQDMADRTERMTKRAEERMKALKDAFNRETNEMKRVTTKGFGTIHSEMLRYLSKINKNVAGTTGLAPGPGGGQLRPGARGMRIPGKGLRDTVPVAPGAIAAPGELIVNRHTERDHDRDARATGLPTLYERINREHRPHSAPLERAMHGRYLKGHQHARGGRVQSFAQGGIVPIPGMPGESIHSSILGDVSRLIQRYRLLVTDGYAPTGHAASGEHPKGLAIDVVPGAGGSWDLIDQLAAWAEPSQNAPRPPFRWVGYTGDPNHGRGNHLHLSWGGTGGNLGAVGGMPGIMKTPRIKMPGAHRGGRGLRGQASASALRRVRRRAQGRVNQAYGGAAGRGGGDLAAGVSGTNQEIGHQMMLKMWPEGQWPALKELWNRESGWRNVMNTAGSGATGIPQALPGSKMASEGADWATNPKTQIAWGLKYIKGRYGSPSAALAFHTANNWYQRGGRVGGGTLVVGDSLGVGTAPHLREVLGGPVSADTVGGRSSASGIGAMRGMIGGGDYSRVLLDLGTNDASAGQLRASIREARRMAGGVPIYVPTVHGPAAAQKNRMLQRMDRRGLINVIDWAGQSEGLMAGDNIHATGAGYQQRARMIAQGFAEGGGGGIPWFGQGGDFVAKRPTVIGVGDRPGGERVTVRPAGQARSGPLVGEMKIINSRGGDVREQVIRELRQALRGVRRELEHAGVEDGDLT